MPQHTKNIQIAKRVRDGPKRGKRGGREGGSSVAFECATEVCAASAVAAAAVRGLSCLSS